MSSVQIAPFFSETTDSHWPDHKGIINPQWATVHDDGLGFHSQIDRIAILAPGTYLITSTSPGSPMLAMVFTVYDDGSWKPGIQQALNCTRWPPKS